MSPLQFHWGESDTSQHLLHQDDRHLDDLRHDLPLLRNLACLAQRSIQDDCCSETRLVLKVYDY